MFEHIIEFKKSKYDENGILVSDFLLSNEIEISKKAWERIYDYDLEELKKDRKDFDGCKLFDHMESISKSFKFDSNTYYLEIGCGPAHIGDYLMENHDVYFIGVDFNYNMLLTLKKYFDKKGYKKYLLIHGDINDMPIKNNTIDFVYGGGVIEHMSDTNKILKELYRILKSNGVSFNTVPAFNLWWLTRFYNTIPFSFCRKWFDFLHLTVLKGKLLESGSGYQLGYTPKNLFALHKKVSFRDIYVSAFAFHPSRRIVKSKILSNLFYQLHKFNLFCAVYQVYGKK